VSRIRDVRTFTIVLYFWLISASNSARPEEDCSARTCDGHRNISQFLGGDWVQVWEASQALQHSSSLEQQAAAFVQIRDAGHS